MAERFIKYIGSNALSHHAIYCMLVLMCLLTSTQVQARDTVSSDVIEISPGIGYYNFDDDRDLTDKPMASLGLGMHLSRRWAILLHYSALNTRKDEDGANLHVDMQKYHVDGHYFFNTESAWRPYIVAGIGQMDLIDSTSDINKNMLNAGAGLSYKITPSWFVRADARIFASTNGDYNDDAVTLSIGYRFNGGEK